MTALLNTAIFQKLSTCNFLICNANITIQVFYVVMQCQGNQSIMLGSSQCTSASFNTYFLLMIIFAVMEVALVGFLLACDFTVANGTINIFYLYLIEPSSSPWASPIVLVPKNGWQCLILCRLSKAECSDNKRRIPFATHQ